MTYSTGVTERDEMYRSAIAECLALHEQPVLTAVAAKLPQDFAPEEDELEKLLAEMSEFVGVRLRNPNHKPRS